MLHRAAYRFPSVSAAVHEIDLFFWIIDEFGTKFLQPDKMGIKPAAADFIAARDVNISFSEPGQQRAQDHDGSAQAATFSLNSVVFGDNPRSISSASK